jgi:hypothetical protein
MLMKAVIALLLLSFSIQAEVIESAPLDIDGQYQRPRTASEKMKRMREHMERKTEQLVQKQIQTMRLKREMQLQKDLQKTFNAQMEALNAIN